MRTKEQEEMELDRSIRIAKYFIIAIAFFMLGLITSDLMLVR